MALRKLFNFSASKNSWFLPTSQGCWADIIVVESFESKKCFISVCFPKSVLVLENILDMN